jgi:hypothetical protein
MRTRIYGIAIYLLAAKLPGDIGLSCLPDRKVFLSGKARIKACVFSLSAVLPLPSRQICGKGAF